MSHTYSPMSINCLHYKTVLLEFNTVISEQFLLFVGSIPRVSMKISGCVSNIQTMFPFWTFLKWRNSHRIAIDFSKQRNKKSHPKTKQTHQTHTKKAGRGRGIQENKDSLFHMAQLVFRSLLWVHESSSILSAEKGSTTFYVNRKCLFSLY